MSLALALMMSLGSPAPQTYVDDVFSAWTYTGTSASQTIANGIDLAGKGGLVWTKERSASGNTVHQLIDTVRGGSKALQSSNTGAEDTQAQRITSFNSNGFTLGTWSETNNNASTFASWSFRQAAKFFHGSSKSHTNGAASTVDLSALGAVGMVFVKRYDSTGSWLVWHRSLTSGKLMYLEQLVAETTDANISVSGTTLTIASGNATGSYMVYAWAHDTAATSLVQCGSFTTDGSGNATVTLGWEPQLVAGKRIDGTGAWNIQDIARGMSVTTGNYLRLDSTNSESDSLSVTPTATGFKVQGTLYAASATISYMAIRRPNKPPTSGTQVYSAVARTGTGAAATVTGVGFAPDVVLSKSRDGYGGSSFWDRLRGPAARIATTATDAEGTNTTSITSFDPGGLTLGTDGTGHINQDTKTYVNYFIRRAPGFMDEVCYPGTGSAHSESHNLGVAPELIIFKDRTTAGTSWPVRYVPNGSTTDRFTLNQTNAGGDSTNYWSGAPTATTFPVGTNGDVNASGDNFVAYLFATLAGISKVGGYTGTATTLQINCGFSAGARFVLIKRIDSSGDWYLWDSVRGIVSGNDPYLLINSTAAEVTSTDYIDPYSPGFELSSSAPAAINANGGTYLFLAIA